MELNKIAMTFVGRYGGQNTKRGTRDKLCKQISAPSATTRLSDVEAGVDESAFNFAPLPASSDFQPRKVPDDTMIGMIM